jgi:hypothetical protein
MYLYKRFVVMFAKVDDCCGKEGLNSFLIRFVQQIRYDSRHSMIFVSRVIHNKYK